ncbi:krev interaction trapped protein 1-like isoform X2 [Lineus longissimus]|uniref:krev interaction trapped protein 1-like isoform X2 n=1 Tax=Lineus longissimus TaxID=88925 RepID=UPI00315CC203
MDSIIAVIRPKHRQSQNQEFRPRNFDILLVEYANERAKTVKQLPRINVPYSEDPAEYMKRTLYHITGADKGGIKTKRAIYIPPARNEPGDQGIRESYTKGTLFCLPVDSRERLNASFVENAPSNPRFYSLDTILDSHNNPVVYSKQTKFMLRRLESWLREKHALVPGFTEALFRASSEYRLKTVVTNPAFIPLKRQDKSDFRKSNSSPSEEIQHTANEALAKMVALEKCDMVVINPLFGSGLPYKNKDGSVVPFIPSRMSGHSMVDAFAINRFWKVGLPDYSKMKVPETHDTLSKASVSESWIEEFPLHKCAYEGDCETMKELINKGHSVIQKDQVAWTPIHYAAWKGHLDAVKLLLTEGECPPNITNDSGSTPLHFASLCGHPLVIEALLNHRDIDVNAKDREGKTPLNLCEHVPKPDWQAAARLLQKAIERPAPKIQVHLMDGSYRMLSLVSGANTSVQELNQQMVRELEMPESCKHIFTIWICSKYLQLQLKYDHKPIQHLNDWKRKIVGMLTDFDPQKEDPKLFWKRDARLTIVDERKIRHAPCTNYLFHEAYQNYIKSLYPCADEDAVILGALLLQLNQGDYDTKKAKSFFSNEKNLQTLIPVGKLKARGVNWSNKLQARYKQVSSHLKDKTTEDLKFRFLTLCWNLTVYGSAFFTGYVNIKSSKTPVAVYIGVNDIGLHIIHGHNKMMLQSFNYNDIDWKCDSEWSTLQVRLKSQPRAGVSLRTKQAGLIYHLMSKLAQINGAPLPQSVT